MSERKRNANDVFESSQQRTRLIWPLAPIPIPIPDPLGSEFDFRPRQRSDEDRGRLDGRNFVASIKGNQFESRSNKLLLPLESFSSLSTSQLSLSLIVS